MTRAQLRQAVVNRAAAEELATEASKYWKDVLPSNWTGPYPRHWCGAFTLWVLRQELGCSWHWEVGRGYLYRLRRTTEPDLGDICYMDQPYQHHGLLTAIGLDADGKPYIISQDGNSGDVPGGQCLEQYRAREKWTAFYSIDPLLDAFLAKSAPDNALHP
jgi:hypothetical protein